MLKSSIYLLIAVLLSTTLTAQNTFKPDYIPPTDQELLDWWESIDEESKISELRKLEQIENTIPKIKVPVLKAVLSKDGSLFIFMEDPINIKIDYLEYDVTMETVKIENFYDTPVKGLLDFLIPAVVGAGSSVFGVAIAEKAEPWQYGISAIGGICFSLIIPLTSN